MPPKKTKNSGTQLKLTDKIDSKQKKAPKKDEEEEEDHEVEVEQKKKPAKKKNDESEDEENNSDQEEEEKTDAKSKPSSKGDTYSKEGNYQGALGNGKFGKDTIVISSWNVNGIRAVQKKGELENYIKSLNPDVICLNESKIDSEAFKKDSSLMKMIPSEYKQFWNFCKPPNKGYAGTAIFSKVEPISVQFDIGTKKHDQEGRTITLEYDKFYLVACYVPNAGQGLKRLDYRVKEWDLDFQKFLNDLKSKKNVILCGDLNVCHQEIDIAKPKGNEKSAGFTKEERAEFTKFLSQGWVDSFRKKYPTKVQYSYWNLRSGARKTNQGWRLDYFVVNEKFYPFIQDSTINNDIMGSDHCPIELKIDNKQLKS
ncbi:hypothetical protein ABPG74_001423 [Tetrahymena malaccensis]